MDSDIKLFHFMFSSVVLNKNSGAQVEHDTGKGRSKHGWMDIINFNIMYVL